MDKRTKGCLLIAIRVILLIAVEGIAVMGGTGSGLHRHLGVETARQAPQDVAREMHAVRARLGFQEPFAVLDGDERGPRAGTDRLPLGWAKRIELLHVMAFDAADGNLIHLTMPFWLVRLALEGKLSAGSETLRVTGAHLEWPGPGLLADERKPDGSRRRVWTE